MAEKERKVSPSKEMEEIIKKVDTKLDNIKAKNMMESIKSDRQKESEGIDEIITKVDEELGRIKARNGAQPKKGDRPEGFAITDIDPVNNQRANDNVEGPDNESYDDAIDVINKHRENIENAVNEKILNDVKKPIFLEASGLVKGIVVESDQIYLSPEMAGSFIKYLGDTYKDKYQSNIFLTDEESYASTESIYDSNNNIVATDKMINASKLFQIIDENYKISPKKQLNILERFVRSLVRKYDDKKNKAIGYHKRKGR